MRRSVAVGAVTAAVAVAGCSGGSAARVAQPTQPAATTSTTTPTADTVPTPPASPPARPLTRAQLTAALLKLNDMPSGWTTEDPGPNRDAGTTFCGKPLDAAPYTRVQTGYSKSSAGPYAYEVLRGYRSAAALKRHLDASEKAAATCHTWTSQGTEFTIRPLSFAEIGERTFAVRLDFSGGESVDVFSVVGTTLVQTIVGGVAADPDLTESIARKAVARLSSA